MTILLFALVLIKSLLPREKQASMDPRGYALRDSTCTVWLVLSAFVRTFLEWVGLSLDVSK